MKNSTKWILFTGLFLAGCASQGHDTEESYLNPFVPDGAQRRATRFADVQAGIGAREDGTLYAASFSGSEINSLGRDKLDSIADADTADTVEIHLDVASDSFSDRSESVLKYLQDKGMARSHVTVTLGANDKIKSSAANGLTMYPKTDTSVEASAGSSANSNTSSGGTTGAAH